MYGLAEQVVSGFGTKPLLRGKCACRPLDVDASCYFFSSDRQYQSGTNLALNFAASAASSKVTSWPIFLSASR